MFIGGKRVPFPVDPYLAAAFVLAPLFWSTLACAAPICVPGPCIDVTAGKPQSIAEGTGPIPVQFTVKNNTGVPLILDYALATINHGPPDTDDFINFSGVNGNMGLVGGLGNQALTLGIGATGTFNYSVSSPGDSGENADFGKDPVTFSVEYSPLIKGNTNNRLVFNIFGLLIVNPTLDNPMVPGSLTTLLSYFTLPPGVEPVQPAVPTLLYTNGITGGPQSTTVTVFDPEPSSLLLECTGIFGMLGLAWFRRRRSG